MNNPALCIDVSKSSSFATGFLSYNKPYSKPFDFSHSPEGMKSALRCLKELQNNTCSKPDVVLEATGNFYKPVTQYFIDLGYSVYVLNPLQTSMEKRKSIRKIKTDPVDTNRIAQVYYTNDLTPFKEQKHDAGVTIRWTRLLLQQEKAYPMMAPSNPISGFCKAM